MKGLLALALLAVAGASMASLVPGAGYLGVALPGGLPLGNAIAALGLVCLARASVALAGNLLLNFAGWRGSVWLGFSLVIHVAALCTLAWALTSRWLAMLRRASAT